MKEADEVDPSGAYAKLVFGFVIAMMLFFAAFFFLMMLGVYSDARPW